MKMAQTNSNQVRLYTRFISILKAIQYLGFFVVVVLSLFFYFVTGYVTISPFGTIFIVYILLQAVVGCGIVYIFTQGLIAIIDLLSRIEQNTRRL